MSLANAVSITYSEFLILHFYMDQIKMNVKSRKMNIIHPKKVETRKNFGKPLTIWTFEHFYNV